MLSGTSMIGSAWGYHVNPGNASSLKFTVTAHSLVAELGTSPLEAQFNLQVVGSSSASLDLVGRYADSQAATPTAPVAATIAPMQAQNVSWTLDLSAYVGGVATIHIACTCPDRPLQSLAIPLILKLHLGNWGCLAQDDTCPSGSKCNYCR